MWPPLRCSGQQITSQRTPFCSWRISGCAFFPIWTRRVHQGAVTWASQLERVGCEVDAFSFDGLRRADGEPVADLNDLALVDADDFEAERSDLERILPQ